MKATKSTNKAVNQLEDMKIFFENMRDKKQTYYDGKSEKWQEGDKGTEIQQDISDLESIISDCESLVDNINSTFEID